MTEPVIVDAPDGVPAPAPSTLRRAVRRFVRMPVPMLAFSYIVLLLLVAILGRHVATHAPESQSLDRFASPSVHHWLGTDDLGRDLYSRLVIGTRVSVRSGFQVAAMALAIALPLGLLAGYKGGWFDLGLMRVVDGIHSFPGLVLALSIAAVLGPGLTNAMIAITIVIVPSFVRLIRGQALALREEVYVEASQSIGTPTRTILWRRVVPGVLSPLIVSASLLLGYSMLIEASLSFLGLGQQPPAPSWGNMLQRGFDFIFSEPLQVMVPGVAIALAVLSFNLFGDGLRDALGQAELRPLKGVKRGRLGLMSVMERRSPSEPVAEVETGALLAVRDLSVAFGSSAGLTTVVDRVSFSVAPGEVLGIVGESGCGKSVTASAIMRLIPTPPGVITGGEVVFDGRDLLGLSFAEMRRIRGAQISMIFQDPMSSLNPAFTVGNLLVEAIRLHQDLSKEQARARATELLDLVRIPDAQGRLADYPHRLSGGMRQRVLIAMALANQPRLLIADEPTTALDVTVQSQILELLTDLQAELGMAMVFVTHDLGVVADVCDRVAVMYAGQIVEQGGVYEVFRQPRHPYTQALLRAIPQLNDAGERLTSIPGVVPVPSRWPAGCRFASRCAHADDRCVSAPVALERLEGGELVRCVRHAEVAVGEGIR